MICVLFDDNGDNFKVYDYETKEDLTNKYQVNQLVLKTNEGTWVTGFHVGVECSDEVLDALEVEA